MKIKEGGVMDIQKERELCEVEFEKEWDSFCEAYGNGYNKSVAKYFFFEAWQAAKADAVPEGFVVVPKEPSKNVIDKLADVICDTFDTTIKGSENCARETYIAAIKYGVKDD